jgi:glycosyltransferase involved in cell wall biosynthesis
MQALRISIIIPSYNQGQYLEECLLSLFSQNYPNLEIIVIDGGSTDNSADIIEKYKDKIHYWISEKDEGQSHAINKGLEHSTGTIASWLCSDDMYTPGALESVNKIFQTCSPEVGLVYGTSELFRNDKTIRIEDAPENMNIERILAGMSFPQPSSFFRRSLIEVAGSLNQKLHFGMDYDLFSRFRMVCEFMRVDNCFSRYRMHDKSKTVAFTSKFIGDWSLVFTSICEGLGMHKGLARLEKLNIRAKGNIPIAKYFASHSGRVRLNEELMTFYFLSNVLRYDYESENFYRARLVAKELFTNYLPFLKEDAPLLVISKRAKFVPPFLLHLARRFSRK